MSKKVKLRIIGVHNGAAQGAIREFEFGHAQTILRMQDARPLEPDYELADDGYEIVADTTTISIVPVAKKVAAKVKSKDADTAPDNHIKD